MTTLFVAALVLSGTQANPIAELRMLEGTWKGTASGPSGVGEAVKVFEPVFDGRYLKVETTVTFPGKDGKKGEVHRDMGFFSYDRVAKRLSLREYHVEGFVNTYSLDSSSDNSWTFVSREIENVPEGFRARVILTLSSGGLLKEEFALAEKGKEFEVYSSSSLKRANSSCRPRSESSY